MAHKEIAIEVTYIGYHKQFFKHFKVEQGTTALQSVEFSGVLEEFEELRGKELQLGVFSQRITSSHILKDQDRIEIYRPLRVDPKENRRIKALRNKK